MFLSDISHGFSGGLLLSFSDRSLGIVSLGTDGGATSLRTFISPFFKRLMKSSPFCVKNPPILSSFFVRSRSVSLIEKLGILRKSSFSSAFLRRRALREREIPESETSDSFSLFAYL